MKPSRIIAALLTLALVACQTELYDGLDQREANGMVAALARAGIEASREEVEPGNFRVMVAEEDFAAAVEALEQVGLPRRSFMSLGDVFPGDGLITSPYEQRLRTVFALNQEIAQTVTMIDGVVDARVHVVLPELDLRGQPLTRPSASIVVQHRPGVDVDDLGARIRLMVANAVQGLTYREVAVAFFPVGGAVPAQPAAATVLEPTGPEPTVVREPLLPPPPAVPGTSTAAIAGPSAGSMLIWFVALAMLGAGIALRLRDKRRSVSAKAVTEGKP